MACRSALLGRLAAVAILACVPPLLTLGVAATPAARGLDETQADARQRGMYVSVVTPQGVPVTNLSNREFVVREDGVRREVLEVEKAEEPITMAIVVDNSQAAARAIPDIRNALTKFVARFAGRNSISVTTCGDRPSIQQDYTLVASQVERGVGRIFSQPGSGSYLLRALMDVSAGFMVRDFDRGVILGIATEGPEFSDLPAERVVAALRKSGAAYDAMILGQNVGLNPLSDSVRDFQRVMEDGPRATGGRRFELLSSMSLDGALKKLGDQLTNEYVITYARPQTLIPPEKIEVSVTRRGLDARGTPIKPTRE